MDDNSKYAKRPILRVLALCDHYRSGVHFICMKMNLVHYLLMKSTQDKVISCLS